MARERILMVVVVKVKGRVTRVRRELVCLSLYLWTLATTASSERVMAGTKRRSAGEERMSSLLERGDWEMSYFAPGKLSALSR